MSEQKDEDKKALTNNSIKQENEQQAGKAAAVDEVEPSVVSESERQAVNASAEGAIQTATADPEREAKLKAAAEARAARAAAKAAAEGTVEPTATAADSEREAKLKAAAEARAARAAAKAAADAATEAAPPEPKPPSPKQPLLDAIVALLKEELAPEAVEESFINELNADMPMIVIANRYWQAAAALLKEHISLSFNYLRNVSGVDYETHMEVVYHLVDLGSKREAAVKVRTDRDAASVPSATPIWETANWNEREIYDLLGIYFPGHPDLRRIMMPDDWVGHPLRKDYEPLDSEV